MWAEFFFEKTISKNDSTTTRSVGLRENENKMLGVWEYRDGERSGSYEIRDVGGRLWFEQEIEGMEKIAGWLNPWYEWFELTSHRLELNVRLKLSGTMILSQTKRTYQREWGHDIHAYLVGAEVNDEAWIGFWNYSVMGRPARFDIYLSDDDLFYREEISTDSYVHERLQIEACTAQFSSSKIQLEMRLFMKGDVIEMRYKAFGTSEWSNETVAKREGQPTKPAPYKESLQHSENHLPSASFPNIERDKSKDLHADQHGQKSFRHTEKHAASSKFPEIERGIYDDPYSELSNLDASEGPHQKPAKEKEPDKEFFVPIGWTASMPYDNNSESFHSYDDPEYDSEYDSLELKKEQVEDSSESEPAPIRRQHSRLSARPRPTLKVEKAASESSEEFREQFRERKVVQIQDDALVDSLNSRKESQELSKPLSVLQSWKREDPLSSYNDPERKAKKKVRIQEEPIIPNNLNPQRPQKNLSRPKPILSMNPSSRHDPFKTLSNRATSRDQAKKKKKKMKHELGPTNSRSSSMHEHDPILKNVFNPLTSKEQHEDIKNRILQSEDKSLSEKPKSVRSNAFFEKPSIWTGAQRSRPTLKLGSNAPTPPPPKVPDSQPPPKEPDTQAPQKRDSSSPREQKPRPNHFKRALSTTDRNTILGLNRSKNSRMQPRAPKPSFRADAKADVRHQAPLSTIGKKPKISPFKMLVQDDIYNAPSGMLMKIPAKQSPVFAPGKPQHRSKPKKKKRPVNGLLDLLKESRDNRDERIVE